MNCVECRVVVVPICRLRFLGNFRFGYIVELAMTIATTDGTDLVFDEPSDHVVGVSTVFAPHAPREPFRKRKIGGTFGGVVLFELQVWIQSSEREHADGASR